MPRTRSGKSSTKESSERRCKRVVPSAGRSDWTASHKSSQTSDSGLLQTITATGTRSATRIKRSRNTDPKPRRSKRIKGLQGKKISTVTPSPANLDGGSRKGASGLNAKDVANDIFFHMDMARDNDEGDDNTLPPGVCSIVCPYALECREACRAKSSKERDPTSGTSCNSKHPCGCFFQFNDTSSVMNIESYLAAYNTDYIQSLYENEFNIRHVQEDLFPEDLQIASKSTTYITSKQANSNSQRRRSPRLKKNSDGAKERIQDFFKSECSDYSESESDISIRSASSTVQPSVSTEGACARTVNAELSRSLSQKRYEYYMAYISRQENITSYMRSVLIDWLIEVVEEFKISPVTLHTAVGLVDRCLGCCVVSKDSVWEKINASVDSESDSSSLFDNQDKIRDEYGKLTVDRKTLQLLGIGCMVIASKMHEESPPDVFDFCYISASTYNKPQIIQMELSICSLLGFNMHIITPHHFANIYLRAHWVSANSKGRPACSIAYDDTMSLMVNYLMEMALQSYTFTNIAPSKIAAAAVYLARATLGFCEVSHNDASMGYKRQGYFSRTLKYYSGYDEKDLEDTVLDLHAEHVEAETKSLRSVYEKYSNAKFMKVALRAPIEEERLLDAFDQIR